jgi:hypothetical protein
MYPGVEERHSAHRTGTSCMKSPQLVEKLLSKTP